MARAMKLDIERHGVTAMANPASSDVPTMVQSSIHAVNKDPSELGDLCELQSQRINELLRSNSKHEADIAKLNQALAESRRQLLEFQRSWSWKVTLPYRLVADKIGRAHV